MSKPIYFLVNDETKKNSYGFHVLTAGIDLKERFEDNPVCLNNHQNNTKDVLGTWSDFKQEGGNLSMVPEFDTEDTEGKEVVRKVLAGKLKGCSMGIMFDPKDMVNENGKLILKKCVLFEVSIVAVPSNANSISLFNMNQEPVTEQEIKSLCLTLQTTNPFENNKPMKILLAHLQLAEGSTEEVILAAVKNTEAKLTASENNYTELKTKFDALELQQSAKLQGEYDALKAVALKDGRIDAAAVVPIEGLPVEKRIELLNSLPIRKKIAGQMKDEDESSPEAKYGKLSWSELDKGNHLAKLKADFPEYYEERFELQFAKKPAR